MAACSISLVFGRGVEAELHRLEGVHRLDIEVSENIMQNVCSLRLWRNDCVWCNSRCLSLDVFLHVANSDDERMIPILIPFTSKSSI